MDTLDGEMKEGRLPVLVSGIGSTKLLGFHKIPHKATEKSEHLIAAYTKELLDDWNCIDSIVGMVNGIEPANTGQNTASCLFLQSVLGKPLLWACCRHYIGEVVVEHVFTDGLNMEVSKSPDVALFDRFKSVFQLLPHSDI